MDSSIWRIARGPVLAWAALCALLAATLYCAYLPLGALNLPLSLAIAGAKAAMVGLVFMRLSEREPLNRLAAAAGPAWLFIMFLLMGSDYFTR